MSVDLEGKCKLEHKFHMNVHMPLGIIAANSPDTGFVQVSNKQGRGESNQGAGNGSI